VKTRILFYCSMLLLGGCITFYAVPPGEVKVSQLALNTTTTWNQAPASWTRFSRSDSKTWTRNGILLDRIMIIPGLEEGQALFRQVSEAEALPVFNAGMLPNEIAEFTESSINKLFGESGSVVETSGLRPQRFGNDRGVLFDLKVNLSDGPDYQGVAGAMIVDKKLYLVIYVAAVPYYYDASLDDAMAIIESARVVYPG